MIKFTLISRIHKYFFMANTIATHLHQYRYGTLSLKLTSLTCEKLTKLLNVTLLLNPELSTLWNKRREMVAKGFLEMSSELMYTRIVLARKPKCNDVFSYRRWLLEAVLQEDGIQSNYIENLVNEELHICELASDKSPNNYHSWNHRMWLINALKSTKRIFDIHFLYIKEYGFSERWASKHVSDFSCFHYRQFCIKNIFHINDDSWKIFESTLDSNLRKGFIRVISENFPKDSMNVSEGTLIAYSDDNLVKLLLSYSTKNCNCSINYVYLCRKLDVLFYELLLNNELLKFYKFHETLWYHRRFIIHEIIAVMYDHFSIMRQNGVLVKKMCKKCNNEDLRQKSAKMIRYDSNHVYSSILFNVLLSHEKKFIAERRIDCDNYADRHEKYLKFVEGLNNVM
ncbi:hypothetical protein K1T71_009347 [Dendrolimus kikuchii]|uniref:Uncharacterized protein n=1 Tax=Dendrolimus kikuchii TaxID=765133 RepID=A0ACC1CUG9_9NEOP|nr:hypothetical protein K1T71_009347 [Dendrolimus kikuchii]